LPWWTTPTKPLVYILSPMTRNLIGAEDDVDLNDSDLQRHLLEVANLRMLMLMAQKDEQISNLEWTTAKTTDTTKANLDATISFNRGGVNYKAGIINHSQSENDMTDGVSLKDKIEEIFNGNGVEMVFIISRDQIRQQMVQKTLADKLSETTTNKVLFATHQEIYKAGIVKSRWQNAAERTISCFVEPLKETQVSGRMSITPQAMPA